MENRLEVIIEGIHKLLNLDLLTKITYVRLSKVTGIHRSTLKRDMNDFIAPIIDSLNKDREFKTEKVTHKFNLFLDDYDYYSSISISNTIKELGISQKYYYKFMEIIELNK